MSPQRPRPTSRPVTFEVVDLCDPDNDGPVSVDCGGMTGDDEDPNRPGRRRARNGIDDDCDGVVPDDELTTKTAGRNALAMTFEHCLPGARACDGRTTIVTTAGGA